MNNFFSMQVLHTKCHVHSNKKTFSPVKGPNEMRPYTFRIMSLLLLNPVIRHPPSNKMAGNERPTCDSFAELVEEIH